MNDEGIKNRCESCDVFAEGKCTLHNIEVCYNDEACRDYMEKQENEAKISAMLEKMEKKYKSLLRRLKLVDAWGKLSSASDVLVVGAIGSRDDYTTIFHTDKGIFVQCGCFRGPLEEFAAKVKETHAGTKHERDYNALIDFARIKFSDYGNDIEID